MSKVVLITGASSGIGKITAEFLADKGFKVYGTSRNPKGTKGFNLIHSMSGCESSIEKAVDSISKKKADLTS